MNMYISMILNGKKLYWTGGLFSENEKQKKEYNSDHSKVEAVVTRLRKKFMFKFGKEVCETIMIDGDESGREITNILCPVCGTWGEPKECGSCGMPLSRKVRACRKCSCTEHTACIDEKTGLGCFWVEEDLCSSCAEVKR